MEIVVSQRPLKTELTGSGGKKEKEKWNELKNTYLDTVAWLFF